MASTNPHRVCVDLNQPFFPERPKPSSRSKMPTRTQKILEAKQGGDITYMDMVDEGNPLGESQIQKMFNGASVFLTGGTGFLGKLMLDKLLRCCPDLKKIYVLARPKKDKGSAKRLQEQFEDVLYERLRKECPDFLQKVQIVEGDVGMMGVCISDEDRKTIIREVDYIIHGAATVRFYEALRTAVRINVRGTREMLVLARSCSKLKAMVHISTAYSNCVRSHVDEQFYESVIPGDKLIDLVETLDEKTLENITPGLLGPFPNTYAFTKAAAEDVVQKYSRGLPVAMFRPSIVIATVKEPVAGWIDNVYGPTGIIAPTAVGLIHTIPVRPSALADLVPGDMVVNATIACVWKASLDFPRNREDPSPDLPPSVYNFVSSEQRPLTWGKFIHYNEIYGLEVPTMQAIYYYIFTQAPSRTVYRILSFLLHWIPAYIVDGLAVLVGKKPMLRKAYTKIENFSEIMSYFSMREWKFSNKNTQNLFNELCDFDKKMFNFDMSSLDWKEYCHTHFRGIRTYLLKDPMETVPDALKKHYRLKYIHYGVTLVLGLLLLRLLWGMFGFF